MPRAMKDSGIKWIGIIPAEWKLARLKDFCRGFNNGTSKTQLDEGISDYPVTRIETISSGKINYDKVGYVDNLEEIYKLQKFDILISNINSIPRLGNCAMYFAEKPLYHGMNLLKISPENINPLFLLYGLKSDIFSYNIKLLCKPAINQASVTAKDIKNIKIPVPPLEEQQRIADYLDGECGRIDSIVEKTRASIVEYKKLKQAIITRAVTKGMRPARPMKDSGVEWLGDIPADWEIHQIKNDFQIFSGATPKSEVVENWDGDIVWITPADYKTADKYVSQGKRNISEIGYKSCGTTLVPSGSIIFSKRAPIGTVAIAAAELCTNQGCLSCVPKADTSSSYYYYVLSAFTEQFNLFGTGTTFKEISYNDFRSFKVPSPPLEEQKEIAAYLDKKTAAIDSLIEKKGRLVTELERLKKALIFEYVTGKKEAPEKA